MSETFHHCICSTITETTGCIIPYMRGSFLSSANSDKIEIKINENNNVGGKWKTNAKR